MSRFYAGIYYLTCSGGQETLATGLNEVTEAEAK